MNHKLSEKYKSKPVFSMQKGHLLFLLKYGHSVECFVQVVPLICTFTTISQSILNIFLDL